MFSLLWFVMCPSPASCPTRAEVHFCAHVHAVITRTKPLGHQTLCILVLALVGSLSLPSLPMLKVSLSSLPHHRNNTLCTSSSDVDYFRTNRKVSHLATPIHRCSSGSETGTGVSWCALLSRGFSTMNRRLFRDPPPLEVWGFILQTATPVRHALAWPSRFFEVLPMFICCNTGTCIVVHCNFCMYRNEM